MNRKIGLWEVAHRGTLFLDEIGDLPLEHQAKILRALQEGRIRRVGAKDDLPVDVRIVAATNRDLHTMVMSGQFREDLYYRLREFLIRTPALRDRPEDIPMLANHFWERLARDASKVLPDEILQELQFYGWMGNVRELKTMLTYLHGLFGEEGLSVEHLRAIFEFYGRPQVFREERKPASELRPYRVETLHHLRHADEILHACEVSLRPILERNDMTTHSVASVEASLRLLLHELEMLCTAPLLFQKEALFSHVYLFKGKLTYFQGLLQKDAHDAVKYWEEEGAEVLRQVLTAIATEVNAVVSNAS